MIYKRIFLFCLCLIAAVSARSQTSSGIQSIITSTDTLRSRMPAEKLYIQFDKPYYSTGDTIWMKAYLFDAAFLSASKSGLVYLELANDTNKVLMRRMLPVIAGVGSGNLVLDTIDVPEGTYTIKAYTNLMRNFGEDLVFKKSFYISRSSAQSWLVNSRSILSAQSGKDNLRLDLQLSQFNQQVLSMQDLELRVLDGKRVLLRDKVQTDAYGKLDVNFNLPERSDPRNISVVAIDPKDDNRKLTIPVIINRSENIDLQFMPEGGNLIAGISSLVGFKAIGEDGHGTEVTGKIYNSKNEEKGTFNALYKGMGSFEFLPQAGENYTAKISLPAGVLKSYPLPEIESSGTLLKVDNARNRDTLSIDVSISPGLSGTYYLIGQSRGIVCYGAIIRLSGVRKIPKNLFPSGIAKFTLLNAERQPLNERITYIDHKDHLNITVSPARESFGKRDSVALNIVVTDKDNQPVQGSFSLAVTDDNQVKRDSLGNTILTTLLLTSDLKGNVEEPGHYLQSAEKAWKDLDNLMLTQGWVGYAWKNVFNPPVLPYAVESEFTIQGRVTTAFNKGLATGITISSKGLAVFRDTLTNKDGSFIFKDLPLASDTLSYFLQARNKNNRNFNVGIQVDEFKPPVFTSESQHLMPWYVNSDSSLLNYVWGRLEQKEEQLRLSGNVLNEVIIKAKKIVKGSRNLNGNGNADFVLDDKDIGHYRKLTLYDLILKRFKYIYTTRVQGVARYRYMNMPLVLLIDGHSFASTQMYMENITAEDVVGIEVMSSFKFLYPNYMPDPIAAMLHPRFILEVTTRGGRGAYAFAKNTPGTYWHKPLLFTGSKQFYVPKYAVKSPFTLTDLRSTIHWEPNIITDKEGKASVSFYSADRSGTYSFIMEGSDMTGNIGRKTGSITIKE
jgi:hypothetical protein